MPEPSAPGFRRTPGGTFKTPAARTHPIMAPSHTFFTSPARSHSNYGQGKELPLHLIQLILEYLDDVADLARVTRTSRLFYYMTLPRLYQEVTLRSYSDIQYIDGRPVGYGNGSPFALGLNTLVARTFTDYVRVFRVTGDWREHDVDDYSKGRVPDNSMMLQVAMRAALDKMKSLEAFAWELNTKPLQTVYEGLMHKPSLTSLTLRSPTRRIPRPTTIVPALPNLKNLIVYDMDPLCHPDNISVLLLSAKKLENLKMHWNPRMRETGEESINLLNYFGRCIAANFSLPVKRMSLYNLYARNQDEGLDKLLDLKTIREMTLINCMGSSDSMTVFLDDTWRIKAAQPVPHDLRMLRTDVIDKEHVRFMHRITGLDRIYLVNRPRSSKSKPASSAPTPTSPSSGATPASSGSANGTPVSEHQCRSLAGDYLAAIQSNHGTLRHLLLSDRWQLSDETFLRICQACPQLEQLGFACSIPPLSFLRQIIKLVPNLWAIRMLLPPGTEFAEHFESIDHELHKFAIATETWKPEYRRLKYLGVGSTVVRLGDTIIGSTKANRSAPETDENSNGVRRDGPLRKLETVDVESVQWIEIWGMDSINFKASFP